MCELYNNSSINIMVIIDCVYVFVTVRQLC